MCCRTMALKGSLQNFYKVKDQDYLTSVTCSALWLRAASKGLEQIITLGFLSSNIFSELITSFNIVRICKKVPGMLDFVL